MTTSTPPRREIVVAACIASAAGHGGWTWAVLQYVLGLRRLGHRVHVIDPISPSQLHPRAGGLAASQNAAYFDAVRRRFALQDDMTLVRTGNHPETIGLAFDALVARVAASDLLINVSGVLRDARLLDAARRRAYLDLDPTFTQLWHAAEGIDMGFAAHTDFVTIGLAIGTAGCAVPTCGLSWIGSPQPIVLDMWPVARPDPLAPLTTVANWRGYGSIEYQGIVYGQKVHALRELMALPLRTSEDLLLALAIHPDENDDLKALAVHRWRLVDPARVASTPDAYQAFIRHSKAEFCVAKTGYARSRCGWISDRSLCYLATGRPVIAQDTGFAPFVPSGDGLVAFSTLDEAVEAIERVRSEYPRHVRASRALAEDVFDSDKVLARLLDRLDASP